MIQRIIKIIKGREISIDPSIPNTYFLNLIIYKFISLLRGLIKLRRPIFLGKGTTVRSLNSLNAQRWIEIGRFCSIDALSTNGLNLGHGSKIGDHSILNVSGTLTSLGKYINIGNNVAIGDFCHIGGAGGVDIGDDTIVGAYLSIHPENHKYDDSDQPIRLQGVTRQGVKIGSNCWIGAKVTFTDGSKIGNNCVVAAGSIVSNEFGDNLIIAGIPARAIRRK